MADEIQPGDPGASSNQPEKQNNSPAQNTTATPRPEHKHSGDIASFASVISSYQNTNAAVLLERILGWHDKLSAESQKDIDHILYLLGTCGYIPGTREALPFVALVALIWARLPLMESLKAEEKRQITVEQVGQQLAQTAGTFHWVTSEEMSLQLRKTAQELKLVTAEQVKDQLVATGEELQWLTQRKFADVMRDVERNLEKFIDTEIKNKLNEAQDEITAIKRALENFKPASGAASDSDLGPNLQKLDDGISKILKQTSQIKPGLTLEDWDEKLEKLKTGLSAGILEKSPAAALDTAAIASEISAKVVKREAFKATGLQLAFLAMTAALAFVMGAGLRMAALRIFGG
jgi:hypothetical protein